MTYTSYKELNVWKESVTLTKEVYKLTSQFPPEERFGLADQMRRAAVSIPSNIAEGYRQGTIIHQLRFTRIAYGSATELETQLILTQELELLPKNTPTQTVHDSLQKVLKLLNGYSAYLNKRRNHATT